MDLHQHAAVTYDLCPRSIHCPFQCQRIKQDPGRRHLYPETPTNKQTWASCVTQSGSSVRGTCRGCASKGPCASGNDSGLCFDPRVWPSTRMNRSTLLSRSSLCLKYLMPQKWTRCQDQRRSACRSSPKKRPIDFALQRKSPSRAGWAL